MDTAVFTKWQSVSIYLLFTFASFLLYLQAGMYILLVLPRSRASISFAAVGWLMAIYALSAFILQVQQQPDRLYLVDRFSTFSVLALSVVFNVFLSFLRQRYNRYIRVVIYFLLLPFAIVLFLKYMMDPASIKSFVLKNDNWYFVVNRQSVWAVLFVVFSLLCYTLNLIQIYLWHKQSKSNRERIQTRIIFIATVAFLLFILVVEVIMSYWDYARIPTTFHILGLPLVATILYSLTNRRFYPFIDEMVSEIVMKRLPALVIFISAKERVFGANKYSQEVLGYGGIEIQELTAGALFSNMNDYHQLLRDTSRGNLVYDHPIELLTKDSLPVRINASVVGISNRFNRFTGFILLGRNYEYLKKLENRMADRKQKVTSLEKLHKELEFVLMKRKQEMSEASVKLNAEILESKQAEKHIGHVKKEKEELNKEMHHRVKNNLQIIMSLSSFVQLNNKLSDDDGVVLNAILERLQVISNIHEDFYASPFLSKIDFGQYLKALVMRIHAQHHGLYNLVFKMNVSSKVLSVNQALPCAIIVNELLLNALHHAFSGISESADNQIAALVVGVEFYKERGRFALNIYDNGIGIPDAWRDNESTGNGLRLSEVLVKEFLLGSFEIASSFGTRISIRFPAIHGSG